MIIPNRVLVGITRKLPPLWEWLLAYLLTDEAYAVAISYYQKAGDDMQKHWYFLGARLALWTTWQLSTAAGIFLGRHIPASGSLDFAATLTFLALVVPTLKDNASTAAALSALLAIALPLKLGIAIAALVGIAVGLTLEMKKNRDR